MRTLPDGQSTPGASSFVSTVEHRDRTVYYTALRNGEQENFFGAPITAEPVELELQVPSPDAAPADAQVLEVGLQGVTLVPNRVQVTLNEVDLGEVVFDGNTAGTATLSLSHLATICTRRSESSKVPCLWWTWSWWKSLKREELTAGSHGRLPPRSASLSSSVALVESRSSRGCIGCSTTNLGLSTCFSSPSAKTKTGCTMKRSSTDSGDPMSEDRSSQHSEAITLRPVRSDDEGFLYEVYASTRLEELASLGWIEAQRVAFLRMQFRAQHQSYLAQFPTADFQIILWHERPIGRLYIEHRPDEIRGIDIALLPPYRQAGIGTAILQGLLAEATRCRKPFRIHVEKFNRAQHLYEQLGFTTLADDGVYLFMEWRPDVR